MAEQVKNAYGKVDILDPQVVIHIGPAPELTPCQRGHHRPAWLVSGGIACGYCGIRLR